jgi:hypothetical protein
MNNIKIAGREFDINTARGIIRASATLAANDKNRGRVISVLTFKALEFTTAAKDSNTDPINALHKAMRPAEAKALAVWIESNVPYLGWDGQRYGYTSQGREAIAARQLELTEAADIMAEAKAAAKAEAETEAKAAAKTKAGREAKQDKLAKRVKTLKADLLEFIDEGQDIGSVAALVLPLLGLVPEHILAARIGQSVELTKAAEAAAEAKAKAEAAKAEAAKAAAEARAAEAEAKAKAAAEAEAKKEADTIKAAEVKAAKAEARALAKAMHYRTLTEAEAENMTNAAKARALADIAKLVEAGMLTEAEAEAAKAEMTKAA